jgi:hypothetical protein
MKITDQQYHAHSACSRSDLADFYRSRRWYEATHITNTHERVVNSEKLCLKRGTSVHSLLLEPDEFDRRAVLIPESALTSNGQRRGGKWDDFKEETLEAIPDAILMLPDELEEVRAIAAAVEREIGSLLNAKDVVREQPIFWTEDVDGVSVPCRCKPDLLIKTADGIVTVDVKTTRDESERKFTYSMRDLLYWLQDAHYTAGIEAEHGRPVTRFIFAAVRTSPHYPCRAYELSPATRADAMARRNELMSELQACFLSGDWSDAGEGIVTPIDFRI